MSAFLCIYMYLYMPSNIQKLLFNKKTTKSPMFNALFLMILRLAVSRKKNNCSFTHEISQNYPGDLSELPTFLLFDTSKMVQFSNFNDPRLRGCVKKKNAETTIFPPLTLHWPHGRTCGQASPTVNRKALALFRTSELGGQIPIGSIWDHCIYIYYIPINGLFWGQVKFKHRIP